MNEWIAVAFAVGIIVLAVIVVLLLVLFPLRDKPYVNEQTGEVLPCGCGCGDAA